MIEEIIERCRKESKGNVWEFGRRLHHEAIHKHPKYADVWVKTYKEYPSYKHLIGKDDYDKLMYKKYEDVFRKVMVSY